MSRLLRLVAASFVFASAALVGPLACNDDAGSGTTGRRIALDVKIAASPESRQFANAKGWTISISKAAIGTGAVYFYEGDTLFAQAPRLSLVKSAFAHPGHYVPGNAKGEMRVPSSADLLAETVLGSGDGVTGRTRSATFTFAAPVGGPAAAELGPNVIVLEGTATKGTDARSFRAEIRQEEMLDAKNLAQIEGCPFAAADMESNGVIAIAVKLPMWFDQVDFTDVPASTAPTLLPGGLARNQLVRGAKAGLAYVFSYTPR